MRTCHKSLTAMLGEPRSLAVLALAMEPDWTKNATDLTGNQKTVLSGNAQQAPE